jgi:hypothetical protein
MPQCHSEYFRGRAVGKRELALRATDPKAREVYEKSAALYDALADQEQHRGLRIRLFA